MVCTGCPIILLHADAFYFDQGILHLFPLKWTLILMKLGFGSHNLILKDLFIYDFYWFLDFINE